jgi:hypothetical protein
MSTAVSVLQGGTEQTYAKVIRRQNTSNFYGQVESRPLLLRLHVYTFMKA